MLSRITLVKQKLITHKLCFIEDLRTDMDSTSATTWFCSVGFKLFWHVQNHETAPSVGNNHVNVLVSYENILFGPLLGIIRLPP